MVDSVPAVSTPAITPVAPEAVKKDDAAVSAAPAAPTPEATPAPATAETVGVGAGVGQGTPKEGDAKKLYMMA